MNIVELNYTFFIKMESSRRVLPSNPRENSNIFSVMFFTWTLPLFKKGYSKILELGDIFQPLGCDKSALLGERLEKWVFVLDQIKSKSSIEIKFTSKITRIFPTVLELFGWFVKYWKIIDFFKSVKSTKAAR